MSDKSTLMISQPQPSAPGNLNISGGYNRPPAVIFRADGEIELGEGYTPTEAADAFLEILGPRLREMYRQEAERVASDDTSAEFDR